MTAVMPELGGGQEATGPPTPQYLAEQLTLFQGQIIPTYYKWHPQCFSPSGITELSIGHSIDM